MEADWLSELTHAPLLITYLLNYVFAQDQLQYEINK